MFVKNTWYVAGWSHEIAEGQFLSRTILNEVLMLWRDANGKVVAFEDRCCHRGAPLSAGRQEGNCVRCLYHGLAFDNSGQCVEVPGQDKIPPGLSVQTYPVVEKHKWIWIWMGDPAKADESLVPDTHWLDDPAWTYKKPGYMHFKANYLIIIDNLLDFSHLAYVHGKTLGGTEDIAYVQNDVEKLDKGVKIVRWLINNVPAPLHTKVGNIKGNIDRWNYYDVLLPGILRMDSGAAPTGTGAPEGKRVDALEFFSLQAVTPETDNTSHYFYAHTHNFGLDKPEIIDEVYNVVSEAFIEDRAMIELQQEVLLRSPNFKMKAIRADSALGHFRWLIDRKLTEEAAGQ